jgi:hypothetical protein
LPGQQLDQACGYERLANASIGPGDEDSPLHIDQLN